MPFENENCRIHIDTVTENLISNYDSIIQDPNTFTEVSNVLEQRLRHKCMIDFTYMFCHFQGNKFDYSK